MNENIFDYKTIPALANYIDRIKAEQLNFKRFIIREYRGNYYTEKCLIRIDKNGDIKCSNKEYAPTKEEKDQIKGAITSIQWPTSILASNVNALLKAYPKMKEKDLALFWSRQEKGIIMVQQRLDKGEGKKDYVPWTLWNDNKWRAMEPETALPFWKPKEKQSNYIMIHEGAKAAIHMDWMVNSKEAEAEKLRETHPWYDELKHYEHWGMIGGALAPHRTDYDELRREKPVEVVYICDNDWPGKSVLPEISKHWKGQLKGVEFDGKWPPSFDLADPMDAKNCPKLFNKKGRFTGELLSSLMRPATWATEAVYKKDNPKPNMVSTRMFREEWFHCVSPEFFVHKDDPNTLLDAKAFNSLVAPFADVDDVARVLRKDNVGKAGVLKYDPSKKPGKHASDDTGWYINTHVPSHIKKEKGDYKMWENFLENLFPIIEDRQEAKRWIATLIARPDIKMLYGMLMVSETQGVGKTTLGEKVLAPLVGIRNCSYPAEHDIVDSQFNDWASHKRLAIVSEIYAGHSSKAYDKLKAIITDKSVSVNKKFINKYDIDNWIHILASSNSMRALKISADDRRWFVPKVTETKRDSDFWERFNEWLKEDGGLGKIKYWAEEFLKTAKPVLTGESAPWSSIKNEMIEEGLSPGLSYVSNVLDMVKEVMNGTHYAIADVDLVKLISIKLYEGKNTDKLERPLTVRKLAKQKGLYITEKRFAYQKWGTLTTNPRLICSSKALAEMDASDIDTLTKGGPLNLTQFLEKHEKFGS